MPDLTHQALCVLLLLFSEFSEGEEKLALPFRGQGFLMRCEIKPLIGQTS
jgi:hypothetical protein